MIGTEAAHAIRGFVTHGVVFHDEVGDQIIGDCPFSGRTKKFYVNWKNRLWDAKVTGQSGNFSQFLAAIQKINSKLFESSTEAQAALAKNRGLPRSAFKPWNIGYNGRLYTLPVHDIQGRMVDLRTWKIGQKLMSTPGVNVGLFGHAQLADKARAHEKVYICEGEWDAIALHWLLRFLKLSGIVVGVPGASTFKPEWVPSFKDRDVVALYDHDEAGENGEMRCWEMLSTCTESLRFVHWPEDSDQGFDTRDWIVAGAVKGGKPRACWQALLKLADNQRPRRLTKEGVEAEGKKEGEPEPKLVPISRNDMVAVFRKWLHMRNDDPLAVMFGSCFANRFGGDPLWLFIVAPPGGMKSELLMTLSTSPHIFACSSLTPHALVSGASFSGGEDPSLIPKLDGKILVVKDFTTTLTMNPVSRDEIFGQLRDCYDGKFEKQFGNGIIRRYKSTFGVIAGVTPSIDAFTSLTMGLGERFLKYRMEDNITHLDEEARIMRAISNIQQEVKMRDVLQRTGARFMANTFKRIPSVSPGICVEITKLAMLAARMRGVVNRDKYNAGLLASKASYEIGTRLGKQFSKLAIGIALYYGEPVVGARSMRLVREVALATAPDKVEEIIKTMYFLAPGDKDRAKTKDILDKSGSLTLSTVFRGLQDLAMTGVVRQLGGKGVYEWALSTEMLRLVRESQVYGNAGN